MNKEQILASNDPRTEKFLITLNSWGVDVGCGGIQLISTDYINSGYIVDAFTFYPAKNIASLPSNINSFWYGVWLWFKQQHVIIQEFIKSNNN